MQTRFGIPVCCRILSPSIKPIPLSNFRIVYNYEVAKGHLEDLIFKKQSKDGLQFWEAKLKSVSNINNTKAFLEHIVFEKITVPVMQDELVNALIDKYSINPRKVIREIF